ncbi:ABC-2 transporter permease [Staphylococcus caledonicus]|uniref:ABC-2 transporter permease n=1 Tax=Staphylococcus caledonicus TaxID=2741333 RepID=UPI003C30C8FD
MKGLLLNHFYSVKNSIILYFFLALLIPIILFITIDQKSIVLDIITILIPMFLMLPAMEVLKTETSSGWSKFMITLPIKKNTIVTSHFICFAILLILGLITTICLMSIFSLFNENLMSSNALTISQVMKGITISIIVAAIAFFLTYLLGADKADLILILAAMISIAVYFLSSWTFKKIINLDFIERVQTDIMFSITYLLLALLILAISYFSSIALYNSKEFK